jgi:hypothetical protein
VNAFAWRPSGPAFRGMLAVMSSAVVRESDADTGWLPAATSGRFGVGRHWSRADRAAFRAGIDRFGRPRSTATSLTPGVPTPSTPPRRPPCAARSPTVHC